MSFVGGYGLMLVVCGTGCGATTRQARLPKSLSDIPQFVLVRQPDHALRIEPVTQC